jgi:hypothetical protein
VVVSVFERSLRRRAEYYRQVFSTPAGKYVLGDLYKFTGCHEQSYVPNSLEETIFNEGMRRVMTRIERFLLMDAYNFKQISDSFEQQEAAFEAEDHDLSGGD